MTFSEDIGRAVASLRDAQAAWEAAGVAHRIEVLARWRNALLAGREQVVGALIEDTGRKRISESEFDGTLRRIDYWCEHAPAILGRVSEGRSETAPSVYFEHQPHALGVVGVISPWNVPLLLSLIDAVPALLAGCAVILKPSEVTPRFVAPLGETLRGVSELASVFTVVAGDGECGKAIIGEVDAVCFTGSVETGRKVAVQAGRRLIPAFLELGGKDPLVVLQGADTELAVKAALRGSVLNTGQACQSIERVYVHESLSREFLDRLVAAARQISITCDDPDSGHLGPFIDLRQADTVEAHLEDALAQGAKRLCGAVRREAGRAWCSPVVLSEVNHRMRVLKEETFAPVIPVMSYANQDEAVMLANDSSFGLSAAVIGPEVQAVEVARRIRAGAVSINDCGLTTMVSDVEKDSFGESGVGQSRMGEAGMLRFLRKTALLRQTGEVMGIDAFREGG